MAVLEEMPTGVFRLFLPPVFVQALLQRRALCVDTTAEVLASLGVSITGASVRAL
jgi:hypothetical protein